MMADYNRVLPRFASGRDKTRPRSEWCRVSIYDRAKEAEQQWKDQMATDGIKDNGISLYKTFYRHASSMHHMDIGGVLASIDEDMNAIMAPSLEHLDEALVAASSVLRCVSYYDEMAQLGMQERIRTGPTRIMLRPARRYKFMSLPRNSDTVRSQVQVCAGVVAVFAAAIAHEDAAIAIGAASASLLHRSILR